MGLAMELACARGCAVSAWGPSSSSLRISSRPQRVTPGRRMSRPVRAGEEVGTEETVKAETEQSQSPSSSNNGSAYPTGRKWTGYVEKDTAGQTNIYAVEPTVYVSENPLSGDTPEESSKNVAVAVLLSVVALAAAASTLFIVGNNSPNEAVDYNGPTLSYYITKFSQQVPVEAEITVEDSIPAPSEEPVAEEASA